MKYPLASQTSLEMGSGEEKTKHCYYRVVYLAAGLVQGVLLSEKRKRRSVDGEKGSTGGNPWTSRDEQPGPTLWCRRF